MSHGRRFGLIGLLGMLVLLAGCSQIQPRISDKQKEAFQSRVAERFGAYQTCMAGEADYYAVNSDARAEAIARAAQAGCEASFRAYQQSVREHFTAVVTGSGQALARERARRYVAERRRMTADRVVRRVVEARLAGPAGDG